MLNIRQKMIVGFHNDRKNDAGLRSSNSKLITSIRNDSTADININGFLASHR